MCSGCLSGCEGRSYQWHICAAGEVLANAGRAGEPMCINEECYRITFDVVVRVFRK